MVVFYTLCAALIKNSRLLLVRPVTNGISFASYLSENINCQLQRRFVSFSFLCSWPSALFTLLVCQLLSNSGQEDRHLGLPRSRAGVAALEEHLRYENTQLLLSRHVKSSASKMRCLVRAGASPEEANSLRLPFAISRSSLLCAIPSCHSTDARWCTNGKIVTLK